MWTRIKQTGIPALLTLILGIVIGLSLLGPVRTVRSDSPNDGESDLLKSIYQQVNPSVVSINVRIPTTGPGASDLQPSGGQNGLPGQQQPYQYAAGSGFVYDNAGHIVTNAHVVAGTDQVEVTFSDDTMMHAKIVGIDNDSDLAVIQVQGDFSKYKPLELANSDQIVVGDRAIAIGNPFEEAGTMTQGIVSGVHRSVLGLAQTQQGAYTIPDAIQTDAALNPGNSGGPLLNNLGQVIGVNEQIASEVRQSSGVSFAIPSNLTKMVADALIKDGKVEHSWLGISGTSLVLDINEAMKLDPNQHGVLVSTVDPGSPAADAGLKGGNQTTTISGQRSILGGDVIIAVDGQTLNHFDDLVSYLFTKTKVGQNITLTVLRNGEKQDLKVTLAARPTTTGQ